MPFWPFQVDLILKHCFLISQKIKSYKKISIFGLKLIHFYLFPTFLSLSLGISSYFLLEGDLQLFCPFIHFDPLRVFSSFGPLCSFGTHKNFLFFRLWLFCSKYLIFIALVAVLTLLFLLAFFYLSKIEALFTLPTRWPFWPLFCFILWSYWLF